MARATMVFPHDFRWGTATAAHQVEGNNTNNDWWQWEQEEGRILNNDNSGLACNWWENAEADLDLAAELGTNAHRMSLEWSRIEPEPSLFDEDAIERYRQILRAMYERGIEPMVTLHHFSNPLWLVEKGDFGAEVVVDYFQRYTSKVVTTLGDLIPKWITINEPMVYAVLRYFQDAFPPPNERGWSAGMRAIRHMLRCHAVAYHRIKETFPGAEVGLAKHFRPIEPRSAGNRLDAFWARRVSRFFNESWMESLTNGRLRWPVGRGKIDNLAGAFDFIGINYYSRSFVGFPPRRDRLFQNNPSPDAVMVDGDFFEVYPDGLSNIINNNLRYGKPIYITGNGLPDAADKLRPAFLLSHLREIWRAVSFNFPVMGYYHWTLVDNFEWERGWTQRFGLVELDVETQERRKRPSASLYGEICHSRSISSDMAERYAPELLETMFPGEAPDVAPQVS